MKSVLSSPRLGLLALVLLAALPMRAQPRTELLHTAPAQADSGVALMVDGVLTGPQPLQRIVIRYRGPGEPYSETPMELQYGDLYRGTIPAANMVPPGVEYYLEGFTPSGERVLLFKSATRPARVIVVGRIPSARPPPAQEPAPSRRPPPATKSPVRPPSKVERKRAG